LTSGWHLELIRHFLQAACYVGMIVFALKFYRFHVYYQNVHIIFIYAIVNTFIHHVAFDNGSLYLFAVPIMLLIFKLLLVYMYQISWQMALIICVVGYTYYQILIYIVSYIYNCIFLKEIFRVVFANDLGAAVIYAIIFLLLCLSIKIVSKFQIGIIMSEKCFLWHMNRSGVIMVAFTLAAIIMLTGLSVVGLTIPKQEYLFYFILFNLIICISFMHYLRRWR
jgi:hypothetical protein